MSEVGYAALLGPPWLAEDAMRRGFSILHSRVRRTDSFVVIAGPRDLVEAVIRNCRSVDGRMAGYWARAIARRPRPA